MGMFDHIKVASNWVCDDEIDLDWQTKDLDCELVLFEITKEGKLLKRTRLVGGWNIEDCLESVDFTGELNFYTYTGDYSEDTYCWREYRATFEGGKLTKIESINEQH